MLIWSFSDLLFVNESVIEAIELSYALVFISLKRFSNSVFVKKITPFYMYSDTAISVI